MLIQNIHNYLSFNSNASNIINNKDFILFDLLESELLNEK